MASTTTLLSNTDHGETSVISAVHRDIIERNVLTRLDGLSLAALSCTSSYFYMLSSEDSLWRKICNSAWPSVNHPHVHRLISAVPNGHRRFFSDSFPLLTPLKQVRNPNCPTLPSEIISAVDIWYQDKLIFSRVLESETKSGEFLRSPFRVNLLDPKKIHPVTRVKKGRDGDTWLTISELEENLILSWIIFDPVTQKSANFSSISPISSEKKHWNPGEYDIEYATILVCERVGYVECKVVVTCRGLDHGELQVKEACLQVKDMDENYLNGKESLRCLVNAIEFGKRKARRIGKEGKNMHEEYLKMKRLRWDKRISRARVLGIACSGGVALVGVGTVGVGIVGVVYMVVYSFFTYFTK
ncbi:putative F-box protein At2g36090 [Silene latifolia]|uniref:putative F-box protein At2g36090 n=1 Tax=Silene latifolia TaxID=37657 RepID=UPI003D7848B1